MQLLQCPHCSEQVIHLWELFILSPFWLRRVCGHCGNRVRFSSKTVSGFVIWMLVGIILGNIVDYAFGLNSRVFDAIILIGVTCTPIYLKQRLFV
jgi:hypothetical protein